jgi:hypothetical protein
MGVGHKPTDEVGSDIHSRGEHKCLSDPALFLGTNVGRNSVSIVVGGGGGGSGGVGGGRGGWP